jgi:hypothetical protein
MNYQAKQAAMQLGPGDALDDSSKSKRAMDDLKVSDDLLFASSCVRPRTWMLAHTISILFETQGMLCRIAVASHDDMELCRTLGVNLVCSVRDFQYGGVACSCHGSDGFKISQSISRATVPSNTNLLRLKPNRSLLSRSRRGFPPHHHLLSLKQSHFRRQDRHQPSDLHTRVVLNPTASSFFTQC